MMEDNSGTLKELQDLDLRLEEIRTRLAGYPPLLAEVEEPAARLGQEVTALKSRLQDMRLDERRLEHTADDRRIRSKALQERLKSVRNLREEAAVQAELDMVRQALEGDEQEALTLLDQIRKMEIRLEELESALAEARADVEPRRKELFEEQAEAEAEIARLESKRNLYAERVPGTDLHNYERIRSGGRTVAVATLTPDGACGHCFSLIPLQLQNEIRKGTSLIACEACGVILNAEEELP